MTPCLTKPIRTTRNDHAFVMVEMIVAIAFSVLLLTGVYGYFNASSQSFYSGIAGQTLQDGTGIILSKIMEGETESGVVYRLSTAVSYMIPDGAGNELYTCGGALQAAPCNASHTSGELYYCQSSPCSQSGGSNNSTARWYYLNSTGTAVIYHHPSSQGGTVEETIYSAPPGTTITLRFSPAEVGSPAAPSANVVEIDVALRENLAAATVITNYRLSTTNGSGAASTFVLLRNHS